jgi:two-component system, response regulator RegA
VLLADDDVNHVAAFASSLPPEWRTLTASTVADAITHVNRERIDLAVIELRIGGAPGLELIRDLRLMTPGVKIALVSGYLSVAFAVAAMRAGADIALFKPVTCKELLRHLEDPLGLDSSGAEWETPSLARVEWEHITRVLNDCEGNVSMAARRLGVYRQSLQRRLRKYSPRT